MRRRHAVALLWAGCLAGGIWWGQVSGSPPTRLTFLSVGQGDCSVFQTQGATVLVDAGPASDTFDAGERIVAPSLRRLGVRSIDLLLLSHPDADHIGGLAALSRHFAIGRIAVPSHFRGNAELGAMLQRIRVDPRDVLWTEGSLSATVGAFRIDVVTPSWVPGEQDNDGSMFVRIANGRASCVFSGDASNLGELAMLRRLPSWQSEILKAGHHGSRRSTSEEWVGAVAPAYAIVSAGRNNRYGHPASEVLRRLEAHGARVLRTDRQGDLSFGVGPSGLEPIGN